MVGYHQLIPFLNNFSPSAPSSPPLNFAVEVVNSTAFYMAWNAPEIQYQNGRIRHYSIHVEELNTARNFTFTSEQTEIVASLFHPSYRYVLAVSAVTVDEGPLSDTVIATADEDGKY